MVYSESDPEARESTSKQWSQYYDLSLYRNCRVFFFAERVCAAALARFFKRVSLGNHTTGKLHLSNRLDKMNIIEASVSRDPVSKLV